MTNLPLQDIQALILYAYKERPAACYLVLKIEDRSKTLAWLKTILPDITHGHSASPRHTPACNIAFSAPGLKKLGLDEETIQTFSPEFYEGMVNEHRQRILGDQGLSDPANWEWGQPQKDNVDILLCLFAETEIVLQELRQKHMTLWSGALSLTQTLDTNFLPGFKEHFGFHDGISQPGINGVGKEKPAHMTVNPGEFIFGHPNQYGQLSFAGTVKGTTGAITWLPSAPQDPVRRHLGHNGSYLVVRQLAQDVAGFWNYLNKLTASDQQTLITKDHLEHHDQTITLGSKMIGRWPDGVALVDRPNIHDNPDLQPTPDISNLAHNRTGDRCPFSAHISRANPRDTLELDPNASIQDQKITAESSYTVVKHHMIIRRGRPYGKAFVDSMDTAEMINEAQKNPTCAWDKRGLHFLCFNTNISRQFEFIQDTWMNSTKFNGAYTEPDSIVGQRCPALGSPTMLIAQTPVRSSARNLATFVTTRGGAYFFLPGISALHYLSELT